MALHPEAIRVLEFIEELGMPDIHTMTPDDARRAREALRLPPTEDCHRIVDVDAGGVPARLYRSNDEITGLIVWLHGGGWVLGDIDGHDNICRSLANRTGHTVLNVGYRLAPEDPFPAGLGDSVDALRWAHGAADELDIDAGRIAIAGDSAGGNLAAVVSLLAPVPLAYQVLVYPVTDATAADEPWSGSYAEHADGSFLTATSMRWFVGHYLAGNAADAADSRVSPLRASDEELAASPPTLLITAGHDPLRDEGIDYARRLTSAGVATSHVHFPHQFHGFFSMVTALTDARLAHALTAEALRDALA